jgi:glutamate/tyrosine decarboxylase-like PLP-dependent enzyme
MYKLPDTQAEAGKVLAELRQLKSGMTPVDQGRLSSTAFQGREDVGELVYQAFGEFIGWNGLFTFQEPPAAKLENDVLDICIGLAGGDESARGNLTSGGTESNFCGLYAMRSWAREHRPEIVEPEIVAPYSTHSTIHKTARYLDIKVVVVPQLADLTADVEALEAAIGENTIGIVGSAPNWPYGHVDPIARFGDIALARNLWLHVDACVGGYILPFMRDLGEDIPIYDLAVPGVKSMSADLHKYGYAPKPCSSILWQSQAEQAYHYVPVTEWACGLYLSQSFIGSRPLGPVAGAWALMHYWGRQGYVNNAQQLLDLKQRLQDVCRQIPGLRSWETHGPLMMIASDDFDIQLVVGGMEQRGWKLLGVLTPPAIHLTLDVMTVASRDRFIGDLEEVCQAIRDGELREEGLLSYGGVGAEADAPKWLQSAVEIFGDGH